MSDQKISELTKITGANLANADEFVVVDVSADQTKAVTRAEFFKNTPNITVDGIISTTNGTNIDMDASASGQLKLDGAGYGGAIALNTQGMNIYTNSATRDVIFGTNETERMRIDGSGKVGIGTATPHGTLTVASLVNDSPTKIVIENNDPAIETGQEVNNLEFYTNDQSTAGTGVTSKISQVAVNPGNLYSLAFSTYNLSLYEAMRIDSSGNVGIGTASPSSLMHVNGVSPFVTIKDSRSKTWVPAESLGGINFDSADVSNSIPTQAKIEVVTDNTSAGTYAAMAFSTSTPSALTEAMRIDSSGMVGIGTSSPSYTLDVNGGTNNIVASFTSTDTNSVISFGDNTTAPQSMYLGAAGNDMFFNTNGAEAMRIDSSGHAIIPAGVTLGTAAGGYAAANTLDDYEEGSWTPTIAFGGASAGVTYLSNTGRYTKIGNSVTIWWGTALSAKGSSTGNLTITGLPFLPDIAGNYMAPNGVVKFNNCTSISGSMMAQVSSSNLLSIQDNSATATEVVTNANLSNSSWVLGSVTYKV